MEWLAVRQRHHGVCANDPAYVQSNRIAVCWRWFPQYAAHANLNQQVYLGHRDDMYSLHPHTRPLSFADLY
jgi:hypothetical protein